MSAMMLRPPVAIVGGLLAGALVSYISFPLTLKLDVALNDNGLFGAPNLTNSLFMAIPYALGLWGVYAVEGAFGLGCISYMISGIATNMLFVSSLQGDAAGVMGIFV